MEHGFSGFALIFSGFIRDDPHDPRHPRSINSRTDGGGIL
jgi:hypothetical protein